MTDFDQMGNDEMVEEMCDYATTSDRIEELQTKLLHRLAAYDQVVEAASKYDTHREVHRHSDYESRDCTACEPLRQSVKQALAQIVWRTQK